jgi:photosystem II stability/assembly factor-like uncharacterized protein
MRRMLIVTGLLLATAAPASAGVDSWTGNGPPGRVVTIGPESGGPKVYATSIGGAIYVTQEGRAWTLRTRVEGDEVGLTTVDGRRGTFVVYREGPSLVTTNGGATFREMPTYPFSLATSGRRASSVLIATSSGLQSTNDFRRYRTLHPEPITAVAVGRADPRTVVTGRTTGIFVSGDGGRSFRRTLTLTGEPEGGYVVDIQIAGSRDQYVYALTTDGFVRSTNGGRTWTTMTGGPDLATIDIDPFAPRTLLLWTEEGLFRSTDGGATRTAIASAPADLRGVVFDRDEPGVVWAAAGTGALVSSDHGLTWRRVYDGLTNADVGGILPGSPIGRLMVTAQTDAVWDSPDGGATWTALPTGLPSGDGIQSLVRSSGPTPAIIVQAIFGYRRSIDDGATWSPAEGLPAFGTASLSASADGVVWAGAWDGGTPRRSTDDGASFAAVAGVGLPPFFEVYVKAHPTDPDVAFVTTFSGIYRTVDRGQTFAPVDTPFSSGELRDGYWLAFDPTNPDVIYLTGLRPAESGFGFEQVLVRSDDAGATFTEVPKPFTDFVSTMTVSTDGALWVAASGGSLIASSTDGGATWIDRSAGMPRGYMRALTADPQPGVVHAGVDGYGVLTYGR